MRSPYPAYRDSGLPWLGAIPAHWELRKLKYIADHVYRGDTPTYVEESDILVVNQACIQAIGLELEKVKYQAPLDLTDRRGWLKPNDILLNSTGTGTLGRVGLFDLISSDRKYMADGHVTIIRDSLYRFVPKYLHYYLSGGQDWITAFASDGATNQIELGREKLRGLLFPFPPRAEQDAIVAYLDHHLAEIDSLIAKKERLIALLGEQKAAVVNRAVTRGLDPAAPTNPSGIPWLGDIPAHWKVRRCKSLFHELDNRSETGEEILLSLRMSEGLVPHNDVSDRPIRSNELIGYKRVETGQMVMNRMRAASGLFAVARECGIVSPDYAIFQCNADICTDYYVHLFKTQTMQDVFFLNSKGLGTGESGFLRLYTDRFGMIQVPLPPLEEQHGIVAYIAEQSARIETAIARARREIELLCELRTALIAAAVTGKIDVRGAATP